MPLLSKKTLALLAEEAIEGQPVVLTAALDSIRTSGLPAFGHDVEEIEDEDSSRTLTPEPVEAGRSSASIQFGVKIAGTGMTGSQTLAITTITLGNPTTLTLPVHGLTVGQTYAVRITGVTGNTPVINGYHIFTATSTTDGTIPVNTTIAGTGGTIEITGRVNLPRWTRPLKGCGFFEETTDRVQRVVVSAIPNPTVARYFVGEIVTESTTGVRGVVVGWRSTHSTDPATGVLYVWLQQGGVLTPTETLTGNWSATVGTIETAIDHGYLFRPDSETQVLVELDDDIIPNPGTALDGTTLLFEPAGASFQNLGAATIVSYTPAASSSFGAAFLLVRPLYGVIAEGNEMFSVTAKQNLLDAGLNPVLVQTTAAAQNPTGTPPGIPIQQKRGISLSGLLNVDGLQRTGTGFRGAMEFSAEAGRPGRMTFSFEGTFFSASDGVLPSGVDFGTILTAPRLVGGSAWAAGWPLRVRSISLRMQSRIRQSRDANSQGGTGPSSITSRAPEWSFEAETPAEGGWQFDDGIEQKSLRPVATQLGTAEGNLITLVTQYGQVTELSHSDDEGVDITTATFKAVKTETFLGYDGDDEVVVCVL